MPAFQHFFDEHGVQLHTLKLPQVNYAHERSLQLPCSALTALQVLHLPHWTLQLPNPTANDHGVGQPTSSSMQDTSSNTRDTSGSMQVQKNPISQPCRSEPGRCHPA